MEEWGGNGWLLGFRCVGGRLIGYYAFGRVDQLESGRSSPSASACKYGFDTPYPDRALSVHTQGLSAMERCRILYCTVGGWVGLGSGRSRRPRSRRPGVRVGEI